MRAGSRSAARWSRYGSATPSAATATRATARTGATPPSRAAGAWPDGGFAFRTIKPVPYPGRTPHIHVAVAAPGRREPLVTQFYVAGEPLNERDGLVNALRDPRQRDAVLLRPEPADRIEPGALLAVRDIVLG